MREPLVANLEHRAGKGNRPRLALMTDENRLPDPTAAIRALPPGSLVILRHYDAPGRAALARRLAMLCKSRRLRFLVAGDWRLAARVGADGLHLPENMAKKGPGPWSRRRWIVIAAAHSGRALFRAAWAGAGAALLAPVFPTASHPGRPALGAVRFAALVRRSPIPVYALGGIGPGTARRLKGTGAAGFAGIGGIARLGHRIVAESPETP